MFKQGTLFGAGLVLIFALSASADALVRRSTGYDNPEGKIAFTTHMGVFMPTGDFSRQAENGVGWQAALDYYPSRDASIGMDFAFGQADAKNSAFPAERSFWEDFYGRPVVLNSFNYRSYRLGITGRYNIPTGTSISPYLEAGTGVYWTQRRVSGSFVSGGALFEFSDRRTETSAGGNFGFGLNAALGRRTNLFAGFQFHQLFASDFQPGNYASVNFGLGIGLWP